MHYIKVKDPREVYKYKKIETLPKIEKVSEEEKFSEFEVSFKSVVELPIKNVNTAYAYYFKPKKATTNKLCIITHGHGSRGRTATLYFAKGLAENGIPSVFLVLPFHGKRQVNGIVEGEGAFVLDSVGMLMRFRQSVIDMRTIADFAEMGIFGNPNKVYILGLSFGGMVSVITMGVDKRFKKGVFILTGGDLEGIFWKSFSMRVMRQYVYAISKSQDVSGEHGEYANIDSLYDPLTFAKFIAPRRVTMFNGYMDPIIPHFASGKLYERIKTANLTYLPVGHGTILVFRKFMLSRIVKFLGG